MNVIERRLADLIIVDPRRADYDRLINDAESEQFDVRYYASGETALRATGASSSTLWMINTCLPDVAGIDLLKEISRRFHKATFFLVGDAYLPQEELAARAAGATFYVCKPATFAWLRDYHPRRRPAAIRAGPRFCPATEHS